MMNMNLVFQYKFLITLSYYLSMFSFINGASYPQEKINNEKKVDTSEADFLNSNNAPPTYEEAMEEKKIDPNQEGGSSHEINQLGNDYTFPKQENNSISQTIFSPIKNLFDKLSYRPLRDKPPTEKNDEASSSKETILNKGEETLFEDDIYEEIKKSVKVEIRVSKDEKISDFAIISGKTREKIIEIMELINYNLLNLGIYKLKKSLICPNKYFHEKVYLNGSIKEKIEIQPSELIDDLTGDYIAKKDLFIFYFAKIDISVNELIELRKLIKKNGSSSIFSNIRYSILCKNNEQLIKFLEKLEESSVKILKYKIDVYTSTILKNDIYYIEGGGADYYVNYSTLMQLRVDMDVNVNCFTMMSLDDEIRDYKKKILSILSNHFSRYFLIYIYDNYMDFNFRDFKSGIKYNHVEEKEFETLYKEYLKFFHDYIQKNNKLFDYIKLKENKVIADKKKNYVKKLQCWDYIDSDKLETVRNSLDVDFFHKTDHFEVIEKEYNEILFDIFYKNESRYFRENFFPYPGSITNRYDYKSCVDTLKDYVKTRRNDLIFENSIRNKCENLLSKIEKDVIRFLLILKANDARSKLGDHIVCVNGVKFKISEDTNISKTVKENDEKIYDILSHIFKILRHFEKKGRYKLNINLYKKEIKELEPILESFEMLKRKVKQGIEEKKDLIKFENSSLHFKHPKTNQVCTISAKFNLMKRKELIEQHITSRKEAGENEWIYSLTCEDDPVYYQL